MMRQKKYVTQECVCVDYDMIQLETSFNGDSQLRRLEQTSLSTEMRHRKNFCGILAVFGYKVFLCNNGSPGLLYTILAS